MSNQNNFIYLPIYLSDWVSEGRKLTMLQRGALVDLSVLYFQENLRISFKKEQIYRLVFAFEKAEIEAVDFVLENYFQLFDEKPMGSFWVSKKLNEIGDKVLKRLNANRQNGKLGGRKNKKPMGSNSLNPKHNPNESILNEIKLNEIKLNKTKEISKEIIINALPIFIDQKLFTDFAEMRKRIKKPITERAYELLIGQLKVFESNNAGAANVALQNSIMNCWQGVFEPKILKSQSPPSFPTKQQQLAEQDKQIYSNLLKKHGKANTTNF